MSDVISSDPATPPSHRGRRLRRVGAAAAVGFGLALGAFGISSAASPSPSPGSSTVRPQQGQPGPNHMGGHLRGMRRTGPGHPGAVMGLRGAVRGDIVVPNGKGGYRTIRLQRGTVTATSPSSMTVKSADGVSETYDVPATALVNAARGGLGSIAVGDKVGVRATVSGNRATATHVRDLTKLRTKRPAAPNGAPARPSSYSS